MKPLLAALIFFTRLPFWKLGEIPACLFKRVVEWWPAVGWLTGGMMALTLWITSYVFPPGIALLLALGVRILITGALHEDGLADCCDGIGGGTSRQRVLDIMKDSHIGTYGVIGLILYFSLLFMALYTLPVSTAILLILAGDAWGKGCASQIVNVLPYARKEQDSKAKVVYSRMKPMVVLRGCLFAVIPAIPLCLTVSSAGFLFLLFSVPVIIFALCCLLFKKKLEGYTGDCCGAVFLLCELSFYLSYYPLEILWKSF